MKLQHLLLSLLVSLSFSVFADDSTDMDEVGNDRPTAKEYSCGSKYTDSYGPFYSGFFSDDEHTVKTRIPYVSAISIKGRSGNTRIKQVLVWDATRQVWLDFTRTLRVRAKNCGEVGTLCADQISTTCVSEKVNATHVLVKTSGGAFARYKIRVGYRYY